MYNFKANNMNYHRLISFIKNNYLTIAVFVTYLGFKQPLEELFEALIINPVLSKFSVNIITTILFLVCAIILVYKTIQKRKQDLMVSDKRIGMSLFVFGLYIYYRCTSNTAFTLTFPSFLCYIDIIPLLCLYSSINFLKKDKVNSYVSTNGFLIDQPITKEENDLLNRNINAKDAVEKLVATNPENEAFTFGIIAPWGDGKTSFMNLMKEYLNKKYKGEFVIMDFNPWYYSKKSDLTHIFLNELSSKLSPYDTMIAKDLTKYANVISAIGNTGVKAITGIITSTLNKTTSELFKELKYSMSYINKKFFVFIDDIDRLNYEEMEEIFRLIRNTSSLPNIYFILAYDKKYVMDTLKKQFENYSLRYTEKILQEEYELPKADSNTLKELLVLNIKDSLDNEEFKQLNDLLNGNKYSSINPMYFIKSIRNVKRIANQMIFSLRKLHGEIDICDYFTLELFRQQYKPVVDLLVKRKSEIFVYQQYGKKFVYYDGKNVQDEEKKTSKITGRKYFNIIEYVTQHKEDLHITDSDISIITDFMNALFGEYKNPEIRSINNPHYTERYFKYNLLETDISEKEWEKLNELPFGEMKTTIKEWMVNKSTSLINRIHSEKPNNNYDIYKLLHLDFYAGSLLDNQILFDFSFIDILLQDLYLQFNEPNGFTDEDRNEMRKCLTENGINFYQMRYLFSLFRNGNYDEKNIFTRDEVIEMQTNILRLYLFEGHTMSDVLKCWRDTAYQESISNSDGTKHIEYKHSEESINLMKKYAKDHLEDFIQNIITYFSPNTNSEYAISANVTRLWGNWDNFYNYIMGLKYESPIISEFKEFLSIFKEHGYNSYVKFKFKNIKIES